MDKAIQTALSGIKAHLTMMDATAHNIANVNTDNFHAYRVTLHEVNPNGVEAQIDRPNAPGGHRYVNEGDTAVEGSNVDLAGEMVSRIVSESSIKASVELIKSQDEILGTVLDILR